MAWDAPLKGRVAFVERTQGLRRLRHAKALVTPFIVNEVRRGKQHIQARMTSRDRKVILGCCFMVSRAEELAAPVFNVLRGATLL